jgi:hypothetical protein
MNEMKLMEIIGLIVLDIQRAVYGVVEVCLLDDGIYRLSC